LTKREEHDDRERSAVVIQEMLAMEESRADLLFHTAHPLYGNDTSDSPSRGLEEFVVDSVLKDKDREVRLAALHSLAHVGREGVSHVNALKRLLVDEDPGIQLAASVALLQRGEASTAIEAFQQAAVEKTGKATKVIQKLSKCPAPPPTIANTGRSESKVRHDDFYPESLAIGVARRELPPALRSAGGWDMARKKAAEKATYDLDVKMKASELLHDERQIRGLKSDDVVTHEVSDMQVPHP